MRILYNLHETVFVAGSQNGCELLENGGNNVVQKYLFSQENNKTRHTIKKQKRGNPSNPAFIQNWN